MIKDIDEQAFEEVYRINSGRVPSIGASVLKSWKMPPSGHVDMFTNLEAHWTHTLEICMETVIPGFDQLLTQSPALLLSPEDRKWGWKFQVFNHDLVLLLPAPIYELWKSLPNICVRCLHQPYHSEIVRDLRSLCQKIRAQTKHIFYYITVYCLWPWTSYSTMIFKAKAPGT